MNYDKNNKTKIAALICILVAAALLIGLLVWRLGGDDPQPTEPGTSNPGTSNPGTSNPESTAPSQWIDPSFDPDKNTSIPVDTAPTDIEMPTGPNEVVTEPTTPPTTPPTQPTQPTEPATQPTEPVTEPTEPLETDPNAPTDPEETEPKPILPDNTEPSEEHMHKFIETVIEPNCVDNGYSRYECQCGAYYITDEIPAKGHTWSDWTVIKQPTTTESGSKSHTCKVCNTTETRPIPVHEHSYKTTWVEPSCEEPGYNYHICSCGRDYRTDHVDPIGHKWSEWKITVEPTTSSTGERTRSCANCKRVVSETVPALDPDTGEAYESYIDPSITITDNYRNVSYRNDRFGVTDFRTWGDPPSIWINADDSWTVVYFNKDGAKVEILLEVPPEDYIRSCRILEDGTYLVSLTGGYNK